tara:strand:+ start:2231 stop:2482 length:252 start_codon:yes stop_codon:yes gene_type:complete
MTLKEYCKKFGVRLGWIAEQIPCSYTYIYAVKNGWHMPSLEIRRKIAQLTNGNVLEHEHEKTKNRKNKKLKENPEENTCTSTT